MVSGDDSVKKGTQLSLSSRKVTLTKNLNKNWDIDMISLFLLNVAVIRLKGRIYHWG